MNLRDLPRKRLVKLAILLVWMGIWIGAICIVVMRTFGMVDAKPIPPMLSIVWLLVACFALFRAGLMVWQTLQGVVDRKDNPIKPLDLE